MYFRLVNFYYDTETPIPEETQSVIRRLRLVSYSEIVASILAEFFTLKDGFWHHKRCSEEIEAYHDKTATNRANGRLGGRPKGSKKPKKTQSDNSGNPDITLTKNHKPLTNSKPPISPNVEIADRVIDALNTLTGKKFRPADGNRKLITARLSDGYTEQDCLTVIRNRVARWSGTPQAEYLRPETLFRPSKFESYLNDTEAPHADIRPGGNSGTHAPKPTPAQRTAAKREEARRRELAGGSPDVGAVAAHERNLRPPVGEPTG